jgi:hypothetical protein
VLEAAVDFVTTSRASPQAAAMKTSRLTLVAWACAVSLPLAACGQLAAVAGGSGADGGAGRDAASGDPGAVPASAEDNGSCALVLDGVSVTDAPVTTIATARFGGTEREARLLVDCSYATGGVRRGGIQLMVDRFHGPGEYTPDYVYYSRSVPLTDAGFYGVEYPSDPKYATSDPCSLHVDAFAPAQKEGMRARFSCPRLGLDLDTSLRIEGSVLLPPRAGHDAGGPPDAASMPSMLNEAGAPSCVLHATGQYAADAVGWGHSSFCSAYAADGTRFDFAPDPQAASLDVVASWCPTCELDYQGACDVQVEVDEGFGGRYAATFSCDGLVAPDGTRESLTGRIDGRHAPPPR